MSALDAIVPALRRCAATVDRPWTAERLTDAIYARLFCRWRPETSETSAEGDEDFVARLGDAVGDATYWEPGFGIVQRAGDHAFVDDGRIQLYVSGEELRSRGRQTWVRIPCARPALVDGFFYVVGRGGRIDRRRPHLRLYLNVGARGAVEVVRTLTHDAALRHARFEAKLPNAPGAYGRVDTCVVYASLEHAPAVAQALRGIRTGRRSGVPAFTLPLAPGLSCAEGLPGSELQVSYGEHRSRLCADAQLRAGAGATRVQHTRALEEVFEAAGIAPATPWQRVLRLSSAHGRLRVGR